ncbi:adenylate kinase [Kitasatospora viridis]|uniref:Adenylate kinase family enzyme n=1 Tax=Kitasatospora viridis TaxID=281105 RepID=A0A561T694_9ACTN|nr:adenylate kinase [Kitasatospora viridis]TWF82634.1 adenylate kinase family enzyme [Kitasatospora viridis]
MSCATARIVLAGICGAGKTTLARRLAAHHGLRHVEIDALYHGPNWQPRPQFEADVESLTRGDGWIADSSSYPQVADLLWSRADTVVWLDLPRRQVMARVLRRSLRRALGRERLWNGNRETPAAWLSRAHPLRLAWREHAARRRQVADRLAADPPPEVRLVHLTTAREAADWLHRLTSETSEGALSP